MKTKKYRRCKRPGCQRQAKIGDYCRSHYGTHYNHMVRDREFAMQKKAWFERHERQNQNLPPVVPHTRTYPQPPKIRYTKDHPKCVRTLCEEHAGVGMKGLCAKHYLHHLRTKDLDPTTAVKEWREKREATHKTA